LAASVRDAPSQIAANARGIDIAVAPQLKEVPDARNISIYFGFISFK
jgi:hypothetical protein